MLLRRFYYSKLAQASYMVGCQVTGEALVVDPCRDEDIYLRAAEEEGVHIRYVSETHIHADYLSGSRQLARAARAELLLSAEGDEIWQYGFAEHDGARLLHDGDRLGLGNVLVDVLHTPGHTPEHISFLITDGATSAHPMGMLTGDFLFVGDVGRPDLLEKAAGFLDTMEDGARQLFGSLQRIRDLPEYLQILPGHGAGSACGKALGAVPTSTLGYELLVNWAFQCETEADFVAKVLEDQPEPPLYFAKMKEVNRDGPTLLDGLPRPALLDPVEVDSLLSSGGIVVDTRPFGEYALGHLPGSLSIPLHDDFPGTCGWLVPYERPIYLVAVDGDEAVEAARDLAFIGMDRVSGWLGPPALDRWSSTHGPLGTADEMTWAEAERSRKESGAMLVDVRGLASWKQGHVSGAQHVPFGSLHARVSELPRERPVVLYCQRGKRSAVAVSVLQSEGFEDVHSVRGGMSERLEAGLPVVTE